MKVIYDKSYPGRRGVTVPECSVPRAKNRIPRKYLRGAAPPLPEVSELGVVRHYTNLAQKNYAIDTTFYPLGSCTMKYNPKICEKIAANEGFAHLHPLLPQLPNGGFHTQGALALLYKTERLLAEITGMAEMTLQPLAGAHGELTGVMIIAAYHANKGNKKKRLLIPDSAHGTNPASAAIAGYTVTEVKSNEKGVMDFAAFEDALDDDVAGLMLTCPNTLGIFNPDVRKICERVHDVDGVVYYDGANMNALVGRVRPGDLGFDVVHLNLHKTFATPHGGGGPGACAVGVKEHLQPFLPVSRVVMRADGSYALAYDYPDSIGYIAPFYGNFGGLVRAYTYMTLLGRTGLREVSDHAVLNANYVRARLKEFFDIPGETYCMHECVCSAERYAAKGIKALDIAKALIDHGVHPPTMYFPLIVKEALMIEPTETEAKQTLDEFIDAMKDVLARVETDPEGLRAAPITTPVRRLDEVEAAKAMRVSV